MPPVGVTLQPPGRLELRGVSGSYFGGLMITFGGDDAGAAAGGHKKGRLRAPRPTGPETSGPPSASASSRSHVPVPRPPPPPPPPGPPPARHGAAQSSQRSPPSGDGASGGAAGAWQNFEVETSSRRSPCSDNGAGSPLLDGRRKRRGEDRYRPTITIQTEDRSTSGQGICSTSTPASLVPKERPVKERCLRDVRAVWDYLAQDRPVLFVDLDGTLLSCFPRAGLTKAPLAGLVPVSLRGGQLESFLRVRPAALDFLARMKWEAGLAVAAYTESSRDDALAKVAAVEKQLSHFHFDFIVHSETEGAWEAGKRKKVHRVLGHDRVLDGFLIDDSLREVEGQEKASNAEARVINAALVPTYGPFELDAGGTVVEVSRPGQEVRAFDQASIDGALRSLETESDVFRTWLLSVTVGETSFRERLQRAAAQRQRGDPDAEYAAFLQGGEGRKASQRQGEQVLPSSPSKGGRSPSQSESRARAASAVTALSKLGRRSPKAAAAPFHGDWVCTATWGLDDFLKECGISKIQRLAASKAPWPSWTFEQQGDEVVFTNHTLMGDLRESFKVGGPEYVAIDGKQQKLQCRARWDGEALVIERSGPQGRFRETRAIDQEGHLQFTLRGLDKAANTSWGRTFRRK